MDNSKIFAMKISNIYPMLVTTPSVKGRSKDEVDEITCWLTGYTRNQLQEQLDKKIDYRTFLISTCYFNPNSHLITESSCEIKVQDIQYH